MRALHGRVWVEEAPATLLGALDALELDVAQLNEPASFTLSLEPTIRSRLTALEHETLIGAAKAGRRVVTLRFVPSPAHAEAGVTINTVRERLAAVAEIVKVVPLAMPRSESAPGGLVFVLLASSVSSESELASAVGLELGAITTVAEPVTAVMPTVPEEAARVEVDDATGVRRAGAVRVDVSRLDETLERLSSLIVARARLAREIARLHEAGVEVRELRLIEREQARQLRDLRASILALRMVPVAELLDRVPLVVRGLRRTTGKAVQLGVDVGRDELDKGVAERIFPAIVHLVRNAVDHGIEDRAGRLRAGKEEEGRLRIESSAVGSAQLEIRVIDDGRGIDRDALARRAGAPVPDTESEMLALLCRAGLSTRDEVSDTSGRGMGMDIVRRIVVEQLGGQLAVRSERGVGTTFVLRVPLTISIIDAFTFESAGQRFAVPLASVDEILEVDPASVRQGPSGAGLDRVGLLERRGAAVSVVHLDAVLGLARGRDRDAARKGLVLRGELPVAFLVDRMLGQQEIVVRPLLDPLVSVTGITGATDLGDGKPTLILDLVALAGALVTSRRAPARARRLELS